MRIHRIRRFLRRRQRRLLQRETLRIIYEEGQEAVDG